MIKPFEWSNDCLRMLDQRLLPRHERWLELRTAFEVADAIRNMAVRGAPAIGIAAAYGMALAIVAGEDWSESINLLMATRPTAVNLRWALRRVCDLPQHDLKSVLEEARSIEREDLEMNLRIGENGSALVNQGANVLTLCNTGALATAGHGTALGIIRTAHAQGKHIHVWSCETRPRQQGLRLTAYELTQEAIPFHAIADSAAPALMAQGRVDCVIIGADRIAANGDTANKIGSYMLAVCAAHHGIPFYVAAPTSSFDRGMASGLSMPIEERAASELVGELSDENAPLGCPVHNPAFDVTPGSLISAIITEVGVSRLPYAFN